MNIYGAPPTGDPFTDRRRSGIGGSDAGAILGVSPWGSALSVWEEKRGIAPTRPQTERMLWGTRLEGAILAGYTEDTGRKVKRGGRQFRRSAGYPWLVGHPDAVTDDGRLVEVKTDARLDSRWGPDGTAEVPPHYYSQVQHYLLLTGLEVCDMPVLVGGREMHQYVIPADASFQWELLAEEERFWRSVVDGEPPAPDGSESAGAVLRRMFPRAVDDEIVATPEVAMYAEDYLSYRDQRDEAERKMQHMAQLVQRFMGARERLIGPGFTGSWSGRQGNTRWKDVATEVAGGKVPDDVIERYRGQPTRAFTLTRKGES